MTCLVFSTLAHTFTENISWDDFQGKDEQMMNLGKFAQLIILTGIKKNISVIPWMDSCLKYVQKANINVHTNSIWNEESRIECAKPSFLELDQASVNQSVLSWEMWHIINKDRYYES